MTLTASNGILTISGLVLALNGLTSATALSESSGTGSLIFTGPWSDYTSEKSDYALAASLGYDLHTRVTTLEGKATNVKFTQVIAAGKQIGTISIDGASTNLYAPSNYAWSEIISKPTTISGYGITDTYTKTTIDSKLSIYMPITGGVLDSPELYSNGGNYTFIGNPNNDSWVVVREDMCGPAEGSETWFIETDGSAVFSRISGSLSRSLTIKLNGGTTEGTNLFTFNNSASKTINITPSAIGAAVASHSHSYLPLVGGTMSNTNVVTNLNADLLDGYHADSFYKNKLLHSDSNSIYDLRFNYGIYNKGDFHGTYEAEYPTNYGTYLALAYYNNNIGSLMFFDAPLNNVLGHIYVRTRGAGNNNTTYSEWGTLAYLTDNVASSSKWETARTITLIGSVTGSVSIDGSANVTLATTTNHTHTFASLTEKPTTISGYGITDAYTKTQTDTKLSGYLPLTGGTLYSNNSSTVLNLKAPSSAVDSIIRFSDVTTSEIYEILLRRPTTVYGLQCNINGNYYNLIHSGNYNSYAPKLDGTGATGTWGISISGNAASATKLYYTTITEFSDNIFIYKKFASINITNRYTGKQALLLLNVSLSAASRGNSCKVYVMAYQQNALGNPPYYSIETDCDNRYFEVYAVLNYTSTTSTIELYAYGKGMIYHGLNVSLLSGTDIIDIGSDILSSLPSGTVITPTKYGSVYSATKLQTARTIWGQSFDGTGNVSGSLTGSNFFLMDSATNPYLKLTDYSGTVYFQNVDGNAFIGPTYLKSLAVDRQGNVGIGTTEPKYKLDVAGILRATAANFGGNAGVNIGMTYQDGTEGAYDLIERRTNATLYFQYNHNGGINMCAGGGSVIMGGALSVKGAVTMASTLSVGGSITPNANNAYTLGTSSNQWSHLYAVGATFSSNVGVNGTLGVSGRATITEGITSNADHDFMSHGNEFNFIPDSYSGILFLNWRTASGSQNGGITEYEFCQGVGLTYADIRCKNLYATGSTLQIGLATLTWNGSALVVDKPLVSTSFAAGATATASSSSGSAPTTVSAEWYNLRTTSNGRNGLSGAPIVAIENYDDSMADTSMYRMCLMTLKKHWRIPMLTPRWNPDDGTILKPNTASNIAWDDTWWPVSDKIVTWFSKTGKVLNTVGLGLSKNTAGKFSTTGSKRRYLGCAIFKKTGKGHSGWERVSNIAKIAVFAQAANEYNIRIVE